VAAEAWAKNRNKHNEICATLQDGWWGYGAEAKHIGSEDVWSLLGHAAGHDCNLLLNVGPLPDGSVHPADIATLRAVGRRIREQGWPVSGGTPPASGAVAGAPPVA
jgi:alpha-L-fucosidase